MCNIFVNREQTELKKTLKEKLCSLKRHADGTAWCFQLSFTVHDPECGRINVIEQRKFTENLSDIMLIARLWSVCLFNL